MRIWSPWKRLDDGRLWRAVDADHNRQIREHLEGCRSVLDLGCGYGSLTASMAEHGMRAVGVDTDVESVTRARLLFPSVPCSRFLVMGAESLAFADDSFDAVVLRDTLHHLWEEGDVERAFAEIERVVRPGGVLVVFDPNPNVVVLTCRWLARHRDARCTCKDATDLLRTRGWAITDTFFTECFALALSGGYVGLDLSTRWRLLHDGVIAANRAASRLLFAVGLGPWLLWRYGIQAEAPERRPTT